MLERLKKIFGGAPEARGQTEPEKKKNEMDEPREDEQQNEVAATGSPATPAPGAAAAAAAAAEETASAGAPETPAPTGLSPAMQVRDRVIAVLKTVYDPEIPVDIYELGLIYGVEVTDDGEVHVTMTLTTPMCPVAETLPPEVEEKVRNVIGVKDVSLDLVWDPPWSVDMMSDAARLELNMM